jgi:2-methylcitrate dehydratase PrpD
MSTARQFVKETMASIRTLIAGTSLTARVCERIVESGREPLGAQLQYTAAVALLDGHVGLSSFTDERLALGDAQALLGKVEVKLSRVLHRDVRCDR